MESIAGWVGPSAAAATRGRLSSLVSRAVALPLPVLIIAVVVSVGAVLASQALLDGFYARSGYPVPYYVGQLSFSAARLQGWYGDMLDRDTLGVYWQTQFVDFGFIAATLLLHVAALVLVARLLLVGGRAGALPRFAAVMVVIGAAGPLFDAAENLVSFVNLLDPTAISEPMAVLYSTMSALKFAGFALVYGGIVVGVIAAAVAALRHHRN